MSETLSPNTQAVLLLTAPLITGSNGRSSDLLTPAVYKKLARHLRREGVQPADLMTSDADEILTDCQGIVERDRLERLLARGFLLSQAVESWQTRAIWVVSRADASYPQRLKDRLKENSPPVLYGCGDHEILNTGGLAVVGSRHVDSELIEYTQALGRLAARAGRTIVSGGARGIDQAAMRGALEAGGRVIGVLADSLEKTVMNREHRNLLLEGQLALVSPYDPKARFNVGHAMQRNKAVYALADAGLVVSAEPNKGGTWAGATEQLKKLRLVPVYVRSTGEPSAGLKALEQAGALPWPNPEDPEALDSALQATVQDDFAGSPQEKLALDQSQPVEQKPQEAPERDSSAEAVKQTDQAQDTASELFCTVRGLVLGLLQEPKKAAEVAAELEVTKRQADDWLRRLVDEGLLEKRSRPVTFVVRQASLFEPEERLPGRPKQTRDSSRNSD